MNICEKIICIRKNLVKTVFLAYLFFINICKITINFLVKRLEMSGEELKKGFLRDDMVGFIFS